VRFDWKQSTIANGEAADIVRLGRITGLDELETLVLSKAMLKWFSTHVVSGSLNAIFELSEGPR
jgi:hypothetical protein